MRNKEKVRILRMKQVDWADILNCDTMLQKDCMQSGRTDVLVIT